ncbi:MAG TPA: hypothetical protein VEK34_15190 [Methylocella sp.]|nr:hypothetical protein [Methylocella sp.]
MQVQPLQLIEPNPDPAQIPLADVLSRVGHELTHLAWLLENLQNHLRPFSHDAAAQDSDMLIQMQSFDHISQIATALGEYLAALSIGLPSQWAVDAKRAARKITLEKLASRLGFAEEKNNLCSTAFGDLDLF